MGGPIYSRSELCCTKWRPVTLPFRGETSAVIINAILERAPVALVRLNPDVPSELEQHHQESPGERPELRYQHASEMRADLKRLKRETESGRGNAVERSSGRNGDSAKPA